MFLLGTLLNITAGFKHPKTYVGSETLKTDLIVWFLWPSW